MVIKKSIHAFFFLINRPFLLSKTASLARIRDADCNTGFIFTSFAILNTFKKLSCLFKYFFKIVIFEKIKLALKVLN